jgi:hypothetical protein
MVIKNAVVAILLLGLIVSPLNATKSAFASGCQGCCSWHGGIQGCNYFTNHVQCRDGVDSPTCMCGCMSSANDSSYGGGGGGSSKAAAITTGAILGAAALGGMIFLMSNSNESSFKTYVERATKLAKAGELGSTSPDFRRGRYLKRLDSCKLFPSEVQLLQSDELRDILVPILKEKLRTTTTKKEKQALNAQLAELTRAKYLPSNYAWLNAASNSYGTFLLLKDNTIISFDTESKEIACAGTVTKDSNYKKAYVYCRSDGKMCQSSFIHESETKEYIKAQRRKFLKEAQGSKAN